ncbi:MAG: radical SAM domain-containing protein [Actinomycetota bacterium]|nr:radical SAM domain-containing protein [Actinomycetota bacterium]
MSTAAGSGHVESMGRSRAYAASTRFASWFRRLELLTRPVDPETRAAMDRRWAELPARVRTPAQALGRHGVGCEGTHGVFPRCNFSCTPCYHSREANQVRVDGPHTVAEVERQMAMLRDVRGPTAHAQLIGGEVSLLAPEDHAAALAVMRRYGREPMSFTHGDFDYDYLERLAVDGDGRRRFGRLSFAAHFDTTMFGRRGIRRPGSERELNEYRRRFADLFTRLRREHGVRSFLAHNMTVTPSNVDQIPDVIRDNRTAGFNLFSFQPAAYIGDERRWKDDFRSMSADAIWQRIEAGAGSRLPYRVFQVGDERCNRTAWGFYVGDRWHSVLDEDDPDDMAARDAFLTHLGGVHFNAPMRLLLPRLARVALRRPRIVAIAIRWLARTVRRVGGPRALLRGRIVPMTFVMHRFMHAENVAPAWALMEQGVTADDPVIRETQERLAACSYAMAHPETGRLVPACVQHGVLDPEENRDLRVLLPLPRRRDDALEPRRPMAGAGA